MLGDQQPAWMFHQRSAFTMRSIRFRAK
jgi:hypothetical protein